MTLAMLSAPVVGVVLTQVAVLATSIYLHRALAHRALVVHPAADALFRIVLWLTTGQQRQQWVAVHRKHHAFTDRMGDPHSPRLLGVWRVLLLNAYYYAREARDPETLRVFARDLPHDRLDRLVLRHGWLGLGLGITGLCLALGVWAGLVAAALHAILYVGVLPPPLHGVGDWGGSPELGQTPLQPPLLAR